MTGVHALKTSMESRDSALWEGRKARSDGIVDARFCDE
jgi:hypothetical protein